MEGLLCSRCSWGTGDPNINKIVNPLPQKALKSCGVSRHFKNVTSAVREAGEFILEEERMPSQSVWSSSRASDKVGVFQLSKRDPHEQGKHAQKHGCIKIPVLFWMSDVLTCQNVGFINSFVHAFIWQILSKLRRCHASYFKCRGFKSEQNRYDPYPCGA